MFFTSIAYYYRSKNNKQFYIMISSNQPYKLYLDDIRNPKSDDWVIARSFDEFKKVILTRGYPKKMSLDHDLGDGVPTGFDALKWSLEQGLNLYDCEVTLHTANPIGEMNMQSLIQSWYKVN